MYRLDDLATHATARRFLGRLITLLLVCTGACVGGSQGTQPSAPATVAAPGGEQTAEADRLAATPAWRAHARVLAWFNTALPTPAEYESAFHPSFRAKVGFAQFEPPIEQLSPEGPFEMVSVEQQSALGLVVIWAGREMRLRVSLQVEDEPAHRIVGLLLQLA
jgi:hypothetical protein